MKRYKAAKGLTEKQEKFAVELFRTGNKTAAYRLSYKSDVASEATINQCACRLAANPKIISRLAELRSQVATKTVTTVERILQEIAALSFSDVRRLFGPNGQLLEPRDWPDDVAAAVSSIQVEEIMLGGVKVGQVKKVRLWPKVASLELLMKHFEMLNEVVELRVKGSVSLNHRAVSAFDSRISRLIEAEPAEPRRLKGDAGIRSYALPE